MSGDYISREQAVENAIDQMRHSKSETAMRERLLNLVAADVRPAVRSKWIKMKFFPDWECEKCGSVVSGNTPDPWNHYHFCPNCGAMMEES